MNAANNEERMFAIARAICDGLGIGIDRSEVIGNVYSRQQDAPASQADLIDSLKRICAAVGVGVHHTDIVHARELGELLREGYPVTLLLGKSEMYVLLRFSGSRISFFRQPLGLDSDTAQTNSTRGTMSWREVNSLVRAADVAMLVAREELECSAISTATAKPTKKQHAAHHGLSPTRRFLGLLKYELRDIGMILLFAIVASFLTLATPLTVESLVNVVSWGTRLQPLFILAGLLMVCLGMSAILKILQGWVVEIIQRRQMVRLVGDLAHRFPRANRQALLGIYPREFANRIFDIMTIQKAISILLLDGISIVWTTVLGLILLAFYHPFLLGFDIVLVLSMIFVTRLLGRGGIRSAIDESKTKYAIVHWLQDVISQPANFKINGGETLAIDRSSRLAQEYVYARKRQYRVVLRQITFAFGIQVIASTALLGLGGWLVIQGQLTLGQLVASELVVTAVVGAFAKIGKSLEKYYDLMAGVDKVGHLLDIPADPIRAIELDATERVSVTWGPLTISHGSLSTEILPATIQAGALVAVSSKDPAKSSLLMQAIAGLIEPAEGTLELNNEMAIQLGMIQGESVVGYAGDPEIFHGTVRENVDLARVSVRRGRVREVLQRVGLWDDINQLDEGMETQLQTGGFPLSRSQVSLLSIARAAASHPKILVIDGLIDTLGLTARNCVMDLLDSPPVGWICFVTTDRPEIINRCTQHIEID